MSSQSPFRSKSKQQVEVSRRAALREVASGVGSLGEQVPLQTVPLPGAPPGAPRSAIANGAVGTGASITRGAIQLMWVVALAAAVVGALVGAAGLWWHA